MPDGTVRKTTIRPKKCKRRTWKRLSKKGAVVSVLARAHRRWRNIPFFWRTYTVEPIIHPSNMRILPDTRRSIELDQAYAFKFCSPSRSSFQSGRLPTHVNVLNANPASWNPRDPVSGFAAIPRNMTGLGTIMKRGGYRTVQVGKWDAGMATPDHTPYGRGYDKSFGYFHHTEDYWNRT
jgi:arylsulfatase A-like enzyme